MNLTHCVLPLPVRERKKERRKEGRLVCDTTLIIKKWCSGNTKDRKKKRANPSLAVAGREILSHT